MHIENAVMMKLANKISEHPGLSIYMLYSTASNIYEMQNSKNVSTALFLNWYSNGYGRRQMSTMAVRGTVIDSSLRKTAPWFREF